ncbi:hypothetical protein DIURU_002286 [Diutina rugosa]|uniref:Uncharacterized protein n=1 Tax=Diutina rugosa TaxID=5481 RepID=A0A642UXJ1_DIURU|nr:uncharacterized protein DIURU_002286 [Diutina rugosa]KAA8903774.1 hypothetical protein DIURU_002286 [Diutina rugosa]
MGLVIGVDPGSSSLRGAVRKSGAYVVFYEQPSAIGLNNRKWVHGHEAISHSGRLPEQVVFNLKQFKNPEFWKSMMGPKHNFPHLINKGPEGLSIPLALGGSVREWTIPELEARSLGAVTQKAKTLCHTPATDAVIAVPDNASDDEVESIVRSAMSCDLNVKPMRESELAVIAHGLDKGLGDRLVAVVHVGQTLTMSLVRIKDHDMYVEEFVLHDEKLCGNDVDERLLETLAPGVQTAIWDKLNDDPLSLKGLSKTTPKKATEKKGGEEVKRENRLQLHRDKQFVRRRLLNILNSGKKKLAKKDTHHVEVTLHKRTFMGKVLKKKYEEVCQKASRRIIEKVNEQFEDEHSASSDKHKKSDLFAAVILGGLFNVPVVKESLLECFKDVPKLYDDCPEHTIVLGGAMHGEKITDGGTIPIPPFPFSAPDEGSSV